MAQTTADMTCDYIKQHPDIKSCLKKGLINYSSLARMISKEIGTEKKTSKEAILVSARRLREKLRQEENKDQMISELLAKSEMEIKNKICVIVLDKHIDIDKLDELEDSIRARSGAFYFIEGSENYSIITQDKYGDEIDKRFHAKIIKRHDDLVMINFKSPKEIEKTTGVISYLSSLFSENEVNIIEMFSCWTDTFFVISSSDFNKAVEFLKFG